MGSRIDRSRQAVVLVVGLLSPLTAHLAEAAVVVESVAADGRAAAAGLAVGDHLLEWTTATAAGTFLSPFDLDRVECEQAPLGAVTVVAQRAGRTRPVDLPPGPWALSVQPLLPPAHQRELLAAPSGEVLASLARAAAARQDRAAEAWLLLRALAVAGDPDEAERLLARITDVAAALDPASAAWVVHHAAERCRQAGRLERARHLHLRALDLRQSQDGGTGLATAVSLNQLGVLDFIQGELGAAEERWARAEAIRARLAADSISYSSSLNNLGIIAHLRGDYDRAEALQRRCLAIRQRLEPGSPDVAQSYTNLGVVAALRGDLAGAEALQRQALDILEGQAAASLEVAVSRFNLGGLAFERGDLESAEAEFKRALEIRQRLLPDSLEVAGATNALARVALRRGDQAAAAAASGTAVAIRRRLAAGSAELAESLVTEGLLAVARADLDSAEASLTAAMAIYRDVLPGSEENADCLRELGHIAYLRGDLDTAARRQQRALAMVGARAPGSVSEAVLLYDGALVERDRGRSGPALALMRRAVEAVEAQARRVGGPPARLGELRALFMDLYRDTVHLLLETGDDEGAYAMLERSRAQARLAMLAERDLLFAADVPAALDRRRRQVAEEADRVLAELAGLRAQPDTAGAEEHRGIGGLAPAEGPDRSRELADRLARLRLEQEEIRAELRAAAPRLASLAWPRTLDVAGALATLDPGTVLLAYSAGERACELFILEADRRSFRAVSVAVSSAELRALVAELRRLVQAGPDRSAELGATTGRLGRLLLDPAADAVARSSRVVIVPDGPLHLLPFAALANPVPGLTGATLVEARPVSVVASATVLAELKGRRRQRSHGQVVAFGDPAAGGGGANPGAGLGPLPGSRREVEALRAIFADRATLWLGAEATEERVKAVDRDVAVLHLAVHGVVDEARPMESALVMARPSEAGSGRDNGLLQVWEVYDQVRLETELVTLSACATALGREVGGEGLSGLAQAFQHAGARTVLASLWSVSDHSTSRLMEHFYRSVERGLSHDQALREAQLAMIRSRAVATSDGARPASHPFAWAAFQVIGDWQ